MINPRFNAGVIDNRFLSRSIGYIDPPSATIVRCGTPLRKAVELLSGRSLGGVVIVNKEGLLMGIFSDRDVVVKLTLEEVNLDQERIDDFMSPAPETAQMTTTVAFVLNMMSLGGYRHVPIVDEQNKPIALISVHNIVDYIVRSMENDVDRLAGIC